MPHLSTSRVTVLPAALSRLAATSGCLMCCTYSTVQYSTVQYSTWCAAPASRWWWWWCPPPSGSCTPGCPPQPPSPPTAASHPKLNMHDNFLTLMVLKSHYEELVEELFESKPPWSGWAGWRWPGCCTAVWDPSPGAGRSAAVLGPWCGAVVVVVVERCGGWLMPSYTLQRLRL